MSMGRINIHVVPRAKRTEVAGEHGDAIRIRVAAAPVGGAANEELVRFLAERLGVAHASVRIRSGAGARRKVVEVGRRSSDDVRRLLLMADS
jgi:uncharacterized protein (TIGR00251 family)